MSKTIKNKTTGKTYELLDGMEVKPLNQAMAFWQKQISGGKKLRSEWYNVGNVLRSAKSALSGDTKKFGKWRDKHFPGIKPPFASCAQTVSVHTDRIEKWAIKNKPAINNPMTLLRLYQSDTATRLKPDGTTEKILEVEVPEVPGAGKNDKGIEGLFENLRKAVNAVIETEIDSWPDSYSVKLQKLTGSIDKWLDSESSVTESNPINETDFVSPEKKAKIKKEIATATQI